MSEENNDEVNLEELQAELADAKDQMAKVLAKNEELLSEAKKAKNAKREAEEAAEREAKEKAIASKDFEQLHKSSEDERERILSELEGLKTNVANEKRSNAAMKIAAELAEGSNAELLAEFVTKRLKYAENEIRVTNDKGELTVSSLSDLKKEFQNDTRYAALLKGNQSSGGGASGGSNGSGAAKEITRAEWDTMNSRDRSKFAQSGGKVT